jgi:hypothetical protein
MLFHIFRDRGAVNALKILSSDGRVHSIDGIGLSEKSAETLFFHGLIQFEKNERKTSISLKGKQFIKLMDELKNLAEKDDKAKSIKLSFSLSKEERSFLLFASKLGFIAEKKKLFRQMKEQKILKSRPAFSKIIKSLEEISLIKSAGALVEITELGKQTIINELLEEFNLV